MPQVPRLSGRLLKYELSHVPTRRTPAISIRAGYGAQVCLGTNSSRRSKGTNRTWGGRRFLLHIAGRWQRPTPRGPPRVSEFIDSRANGGLVQPLAIGLFGLDLLGYRVHELVILPEARLLAGELDALLDERFAIRVFGIERALANERGVGAVRQDLPIKAVDNDIEIAIDKPAGSVADLRIGLLRPLFLDEGDGLLHHCDGFFLGRPFGSERHAEHGEQDEKT